MKRPSQKRTANEKARAKTRKKKSSTDFLLLIIS
jgi:hypothetical protein